MLRVLPVCVVALVGVASCASSPDATIAPPTDAPPPTIAAGLPAAPASSSTVPPTTAAPTTTAGPITSPPTTRPPLTTSAPPVSTAAPATNAPTSTIAEQSATGLLLPAFFAFDVTAPGPCPGGDATVAAPTVTVRWEVIGTESVDVAVGTVDSVRHADLPPAGSLTVPHDCPGPVTYFVVAENPDGRSVRDATR